MESMIYSGASLPLLPRMIDKIYRGGSTRYKVFSTLKIVSSQICTIVAERRQATERKHLVPVSPVSS